MISEGKSRLILNTVLLSLIAIGLGVFLIVYPKQSDDWSYVRCMEPFMQAHGSQIEDGVAPWEALPDFEIWGEWIGSEYHRWLPRLANLVAPPLLVWPKWLSSGLMWICWLCACALMCRSCTINLSKGPPVVIAAILLTWFMPWFDRMVTLMFQLNYLVPTLLGVMLFELLRRERQSSVTGRVISCIFAIILGVLTGSWHEGFGVPVLASVGLLFLFFKEWRRAEVALATVGLICGIAFILLSPGFQARLDPYGNAASPWTPLRYVRLICDTLGFWIGALTIVVAGIRCSWRKLYTPGFIFWVSGGLTSVIICLCFIGGARVGWWADFCGVALMLQGLSLLWPALSRKYNALSLSIVAVFAVVTVAYWVEVDLYTVREAREYRRAIAMWRENPDESVFVEVLPKSQAPWLLGRMPQSGLENHPYFADITLRRFDENKAGFFPFPDELESMRGESGSMVADADGMRQVGDWFVMPGLPGDLVEPDLPDLADLNPEQLYKDRNFMMKYSTRSRWFATPVAVEIDLGGGWQPAMATLTGFKSPADGNYYTLVLPYLPSTLQNWLLFRLRGVKRVRIVLTRK